MNPLTPSTRSDRLWSVLCHLSWFCCPFLFPLIVYLVMRQESATVTHHAKEALNFHLSLALYALCCLPLVLIFVGIPLLYVIGICGTVLAVVAAVKTSDDTFYRYPMTIRFLR